MDGTGETQWTRENFGLLKTRIYDVDTSEFNISYKKTHNKFIQKFWIDNSGFWSEFKFKLIDKKWYLISVVEHNL